MMCMSKYKTNKITKFILNLHNVLCFFLFCLCVQILKKQRFSTRANFQRAPIGLKSIYI